jgi:hypothetical protein
VRGLHPHEQPLIPLASIDASHLLPPGEKARKRYRLHNLVSGPSFPITGSVFGNATIGIVFSAFDALPVSVAATSGSSYHGRKVAKCARISENGSCDG